MDRDSKLIFENYKNAKDSSIKSYKNLHEETNEDEGGMGWFLLQVLDPTGITSWGDLGRAASKLSANIDTGKVVISDIGAFVLAAFCALPNFGLLAAGIGGVGWAGLKAAVKSALKAGPHAIMPLSNKIIKFISETPPALNAMDKVLLKLRDSKKLSDKAYNDIISVFNTGKIDNIKHAENIKLGRGGQKGAGSIGTGSAAAAGLGTSKSTYTRPAARIAQSTIQGDTGVKDIDILSGENEEPNKQQKKDNTKSKVDKIKGI